MSPLFKTLHGPAPTRVSLWSLLGHRAVRLSGSSSGRSIWLSFANDVHCHVKSELRMKILQYIVHMIYIYIYMICTTRSVCENTHYAQYTTHTHTLHHTLHHTTHTEGKKNTDHYWKLNRGEIKAGVPNHLGSTPRLGSRVDPVVSDGPLLSVESGDPGWALL